MHNRPFVVREHALVDHRIVAGQILEGFQDYRVQFAVITAGARERFILGQWHAIQAASRDRIGLYKASKAAVMATIKSGQLTPQDWPGIKQAYANAVAGRADAALAGTFYNSIYRASGEARVPDDENAFVLSDPVFHAEQAVSVTHRYRGNVSDVVRELLEGCDLAGTLMDLPMEVERITQRLKHDIPLLRRAESITLEMVAVTFYRNKGAYLVGKVVVDGNLFPLAIAFSRIDDQASDRPVVVDSVLWGEARLSVVFSFTRSYFMVAIEEPSAIVSYLQTLLPGKKRWELFTSLGFYKHGKTEFFRGLRKHLAQSTDLFHVAEGIKGQVMTVFTLDSYQTVFKIIKDRFPATKSVSQADVRAAYQLVKTHDRVGRMADTQEFQCFELPKQRFEPALLEELCRVAGQSVTVSGDLVMFQHLYTERLMVPLNIYINQCTGFQLEQVLIDYGNAIKELAAANIFPGDMLLKNFGVTRHGRVVFYDYDEICYLTAINFRDLPQVSDTSSTADPWFEVGVFDVFPEEFATFLFPDETRNTIFRQHHGDLFTVEGWTRIQAQVEANQLTDVYPYPARDRLR